MKSSGRGVAVRCACGLLALALSACRPAASGPAPDAQADAGATVVLKPGDKIDGEITTASRVNYNDGSRSVRYVLELADGQAVRIQTDSAYCGRLALFGSEDDAADALLHEAECSESGDRYTMTMSLVGKSSQRHAVSFSNRDPGDYGPFRLIVQPVTLSRGGEELRPGGEINGLRNGKDATYALRITEAGRYRVELQSSEFDTVLALQGQGVDRSDDDNGGGTDSRIVAFLEPGVYRLEVRALTGGDSDGTGLFRLRVASNDLVIPAGVRLQNGGELTVDAAPLTGLLKEQPARYRLALRERARVTLDLRSEDFDARLKLTGPNTQLSDDDSGGDTDSRIVSVLEPGLYTLEAADLNDANVGFFRLEAHTAPAPEALPALSPGDTHGSVLVPGGKDRYRLSIAEAGRYVIGMESDDLDSYLSLSRGDTLMEQDDDQGGERNARLEVDLAPGEYEIVAEARVEGKGAYRISVAAD